MKIPRIVIAGERSGVGKTTVTLAIAAALKARGLAVQTFKAGPDYIDPQFHALASGRPTRNLDSVFLSRERLRELLAWAARDADLALIEGVMGLFDGRGTVESGSTAHLAKQLAAPVILVMDGAALSRSAGAIALGFARFDPRLRLAGVICNRVSGPRHFALLKQPIERATKLPVLGWLPKRAEWELPERHLGLVPVQELGHLRRIVRDLGRVAEQQLDLDWLLRITHHVSSRKGARHHFEKVPGTFSGERVPIAVGRDEAFHFYYQENLDMLEQLGATLCYFSPLRATRLPAGARALYLGGGFPEVFAKRLAANRLMRQAVRQAVQAGLPTYAECGGLMYLAQAIVTRDGERHPMVGAIPGVIRMTDRLQHFGYQEAVAAADSLIARRGERVLGHEFHYSTWDAASLDGCRPAYRIGSRTEGAVRRNLLATYLHVHFWSNPKWAERLLEAARVWGQTFTRGLAVQKV